MKKIKIFASLIAAVMLMSNTSSFAHTIKNIEIFFEDSSLNPGWVFQKNEHVDFLHAKSKKYDYRYSSKAIKDKYGSFFEAGIRIWGNYIDMREKDRSKNIVREAPLDDPDVLAQANSTYKKGKQHIIRWTITVNTKGIFMARPTTGKNRIMGHEIGHVYGLGDLYDAKNRGKLMLGIYGNMGGITASDKRGMEVMTGVHKKHAKGKDRTSNCRTHTFTHHKQMCACGIRIFEKHNTSGGRVISFGMDANKRSTHHYITCVDCGDRAKDKKHSYGGEFPDGKTVRYSRINSTEHNEIKKCKDCDYGMVAAKKHSTGGKFSDGKKVRYTQATASEHNEIKKCKECGAETSVRKKHSTGGKFSDGKKVRYTRANANEHNEIKKCKGCNYEQSVRKKHRFDKKGKCKDCGFVK
ncbi:MAG: hypothetical protein FWH04_00880 [Oscillospiraceae bacterium]|nr:hypothetical protein [Oscillospiraceae bacterium]